MKQFSFSNLTKNQNSTIFATNPFGQSFWQGRKKEDKNRGVDKFLFLLGRKYQREKKLELRLNLYNENEFQIVLFKQTLDRTGDSRCIKLSTFYAISLFFLLV